MLLKSTQVQLTATATMGVESIVAYELKQLGFSDIRTDNGKIDFTGTLADICRTNIWLRTADRVMVKVGEFKAVTFDELFDGTFALSWQDWIDPTGQFPVSRITSVKSALFSKSDSQAIVKKAIAKKLLSAHAVDELPETGAMYSVSVQILNDVVSVYIDTTGEGLHKRGYRVEGDVAPIRETLAAALVLLARWKGGDEVFLDPMCGSGTILIEAAMIAKNIAPGGNRYFAAEKWPTFPTELWMDARDQAYSAEKTDAPCRIYGSDVHSIVIAKAEGNIRRAGVQDWVKVMVCDFEDLAPPAKNGIIITNPPYGERLADPLSVDQLYHMMGTRMSREFRNWACHVITTHPYFETIFGQKCARNRKLYNGGIKCYFYSYFMEKNETMRSTSQPDAMKKPGRDNRPDQRGKAKPTSRRPVEY